MAEEETEILDVDPNNLTDRECLELSSAPQLKRRYEDKWNVKGVCEI